MSSLPTLDSSRYRLLVEGPDDKYVIISLMKRHGVNYDLPRIGMPYVDACGGWTKVEEAVPVALKNYDRLGIVLDADFQEDHRWIKVRNLLRRLELVVPDDLPFGGLVIGGKRPESLVGVWLMPDNQDDGMLENFLDRLISPDALWELARDTVHEAKSRNASFHHVIKARVHTWLAWQEPPGQPFGVAMTKKCFESDAPDALHFVNWFRRIFPESGVSENSP